MGLFDTPTKAVAKKAAAAPVKGATKKAAAKPREQESDGDDVAVTTGWGGAKKMKAEYSGFINNFKMDPGRKIIRFLADAPYANVATHWVEKKGKKSYICLGAKTCPLCAIGHKPRVAYCFNIAECTEDAAVLASWDVGVRLFNQIEEKANSRKWGPLAKMFYVVERSGKTKDDTTYALNVLKRGADDLSDVEDCEDINLPSDEELFAMKVYTVDDATQGKPTIAEMRELALVLNGGSKDDDDDEDDD